MGSASNTIDPYGSPDVTVMHMGAGWGLFLSHVCLLRAETGLEEAMPGKKMWTQISCKTKQQNKPHNFLLIT